MASQSDLVKIHRELEAELRRLARFNARVVTKGHRLRIEEEQARLGHSSFWGRVRFRIKKIGFVLDPDWRRIRKLIQVNH